MRSRVGLRRIVLALSACVVTGALTVASAPAAPTQRLDIGAELVRQQAGGKPWIVNLSLGAHLGTSDGTDPSPVNHMVFQFTRGAKVHPEAFGMCTLKILQAQGPAGCPKSSRLGAGKANAFVLQDNFPAEVDVFNGPQVGSGRKLLVYARALSTVVITLEGTLTKTSGKYGFKLDLPVGRIQTVGDNDAAITDFQVTVGGIGKKKVPFIEAPTACTKPGWPFFGTFTYADGTSGTSSAIINCMLKATNN